MKGSRPTAARKKTATSAASSTERRDRLHKVLEEHGKSGLPNIDAFRSEVQQLVEEGTCEYSQFDGSAGQCANCGEHARRVSGGKLQKCSGCFAAYYCSQKCQLAHWKAGHKRVCSMSDIKAPTVEEDDSDVFAGFNITGDYDPFRATSPMAKEALTCMTTGPFSSFAYQPLSKSERFAQFQQQVVTRARSWQKNAQVDRFELVSCLLNQLHPIACMFVAQANAKANEAASIANKVPQSSILLVESHGSLLEDLVGPKAATGPRWVAIHYLSRSGLAKYFEALGPKYSEGMLREVGSSVDTCPPGHIMYLAAFLHNQGGTCNRPSKRNGMKYHESRASMRFAHTTIFMPQMLSDVNGAAEVMGVLLSEAELMAAQSLEVDLSTGETMGFDFDQSHFTKLVQRTSGSETESFLVDQSLGSCFTQAAALGHCIIHRAYRIVIAPFSWVASWTTVWLRALLRRLEIFKQNRRVHNQQPSTTVAKLGAASDKVVAAINRQALSKSHVENRNKEPETIGQRPSEMFQDKFRDFLHLHGIILRMFAAVKHNEQGPGALFVITRCSWIDLFETSAVGPHKSQDRQMLALWGIPDGRAKAVNKRSGGKAFAISALMKKCPTIRSLSHMVKMSGDGRNMLPMVIIADPSGETLPHDLAKFCREPDWGHSDIMAHAVVINLDCYEDLVSSGRAAGLGAMDVYGMNLDRDEDEPTT